MRRQLGAPCRSCSCAQATSTLSAHAIAATTEATRSSTDAASATETTETASSMDTNLAIRDTNASAAKYLNLLSSMSSMMGVSRRRRAPALADRSRREGGRRH
eukprot:7389530-Prymnesium_polylepis.1